MIVRDDSYSLFYEKTVDDLDAIEAGLLEVEQAPEDCVASLVNTLFRQVHNIKGSASFYDLTEIVAISHSMETLLGMLRTKHISVDPELIAILLSAKDWLLRLLDEDSGFDTTPIMKQLTSYIDAKVDENRSRNATQGTGVIEVGLPDKESIWKVSEATIIEAQNSAKGGKFVYLFVFDLIEDIEKKGKTPQEVIGEFDTLTKLIESKLDIGLVGGLTDDAENTSIPLYLLCATIMDPIIVREILGVSDNNVIVIQEEYISYPDEQVVVVTPENSPVYQMLEKEARNRQVTLTVPFGHLSDLERRLTLQDSWEDASFLVRGILVAPTVESITAEFVLLLSRLAETQGKRFDYDVTLESSDPLLFFLLVFKHELFNIVENAVLHGIEPPQDRIRCGKSMAGSIIVNADVTSREILFSVFDNGRGISKESMTVHAERFNQNGQAVADLPKEKLIDLIIKSELFSLGAFAQKLKAYNGRIQVNSHEQGVTFTVHIPL